MGIIWLVLIFAGNTLASSVIEKIDKALADIPTTLNKAELLANYEIIHAHEKEIDQQLQLSPEQERTLHRIEADLAPLAHAYADNQTIDEINAQSPVGELLYQSDIMLTTEQAQMIANDEATMELTRNKRQALNWNHWINFNWPGGIMYYSFAPGTDNNVKDVIRKGAENWMRDTCVLIIEDDKKEQRVEVSPWENICSSFIGWTHEGVQKIKFGRGCHYVGTATHELGHALGMFHTHCRHDRDDYIIVNPNNIQIGAEFNFKKETTTTNNNYGVPYDYGSIMAYGARSMISYSGQLNKNLYTMVPRDMNYIDTLGSTFIGFYDVLLLNMMYDCLKKCDGVQMSPEQDRLKRQTWKRTVTRTVNGQTQTHTISGDGPMDDFEFGSFGLGDDGGFFNSFGSLGGFGSRGFNSRFGDMFGGLNINGLGGEEGASNGNDVRGGNGLGGNNGGGLRGEEGGSNGGRVSGGDGLGGNNGGKLKGEEGVSKPLPGDGGSSRTRGWRDWWNLPNLIGGILPEWVFWDIDYYIPTTTSTTRPRTTRPTTTIRPTTTTRKPTTSRISTRAPSKTTTTTPAPFVPSVPSGPESGPKYNRGKCLNGGYPSPRDCSRCVCPGGYGGRLCNERPAGAGEVLQASTSFQTLETKVGWEGVTRTDQKVDYVYEYYWIQAPPGRKIEVKITNYEKDLATEGCYWHAMEVKAQKDQRLTGIRLCHQKYIGRVFKTEGNLLPIIMYSRIWKVDMALQYRMI